MTTLETLPQNQSPASPDQPETLPGYVGPCGRRYEWTLLNNPADLIPYQSQWQELSARTIDPNPFYEDWFFLPAARHLGASEEWRILLIHACDAKQPGKSELCGFFPFVTSRSYFGLSEWSLWKNSFCYLTSPLIERGHATSILRAAFHYLRTGGESAPLVNFPLISGEGPLHHALTEVLRENLTTLYLPDQYLRAMTTCRGSTDDYLKNALGGHHVREYRRKRRKLEALGQLEYRKLHEARGAECWIEWFLDLEATGWKARAGTAIKMHPEQAAFFREMMTLGLQSGKAQIEGLFLNGEPIALKCQLFSPPASFAFKIAFDESHHSCSPGVQLEFQSLNLLMERPELEFCDSCAIPGHQMIDRIWSERRLVRQLLVSSGQSVGEIALGTLPLLRTLNRMRKRWTESLNRNRGEKTPGSRTTRTESS